MQNSLPAAGGPQPSLKFGNVYRVASERDSDAAGLGPRESSFLDWLGHHRLLLVRLGTVVESGTGRPWDTSDVLSPPGLLP